MKKKLLFAFLAIISAVCLAFAFTACNRDEPAGPSVHTHTYETDYSGYDDEYHWHKATCEHKLEISGKEKHIFISNSNKCSKCNYTKKLTSFTITFKAEGKIVAIQNYTEEDEAVIEPDIPKKTGYTGKWEEYTLNMENITVNAVYEVIEYTITFIADEEIVATRNYTEENKKIDEPDVPEKTRFLGKWESYTLTFGDINVNAVYTDILTYELNENGYSYKITGVNELPVGVLELPSQINGKPITAIDDCAFMDCSVVESIIIPKDIVDIGLSVFKGCTALSSINIPDGVKSIKSYTFAECSALENIIIPESVEAVGYAAFTGCSSLKRMTIPFVGGASNVGGGVELFGFIFGSQEFENSMLISQSCNRYDASFLTESFDFYIPNSLTDITVLNSNIPFCAFENCKGLVSITLSDGIKRIGDNAFRNCDNLANLIIPNSIIFVGADALSGCSRLRYTTYNYGTKYFGNTENPHYILVDVADRNITSFTVHNNTKCILPVFGKGYKNLTSLTIPDGVTSVNSGGMYNDTDFANRGAGTLKDGCVYIGNPSNPYLVLYGNRFFSEKVTIQNTTKVIASNAFNFSGYANTELIIPDSVQYIGENNFCGDDYQHATTVKIGSRVKDMEGAFDRTSSGNSIQAFEVSPNNEYYTSVDGVLFNKDRTVLINYPASKADKSYIIPQTCKTIYPNAFFANKNLVTLKIPESVTGIGYMAFRYSKKLESINVPTNIIALNGLTFSECKGLTSITIPDSVTSISSWAFNSCSSLTSVTIPDGVATIERSAFRRCSSLTSITIPDSVTSIAMFAFYDCSSLKDINFEGTKAQWKAIEKDNTWNSDTAEYTVHCTDGDLSKSEC